MARIPAPTSEHFPAPLPPPVSSAAATRAITLAACLLGLLALGYAALDVSGRGLAQYLNSDFFTPFVFCRELLQGRYPMSGWTLSASPYLVPDQLLLSGLFAGLGPTGVAYGLYPAVYYPLLFVLISLCVRSATGRTGPAFLASLLVGNLLLALRVLPGHDRPLWWLGTPCCHGGLLLLGFLYLWLLGLGLRRARLGWLPGALFGVSLLALWSDALFVFQIVLPASIALFLGRRCYPACARWLGWQTGTAVAALAGSMAIKLLCLATGWFYFTRILRHAPTPVNQWHTLTRAVADGPDVLHDTWGFLLLAALAAGALWLHRHGAADEPRAETDHGGRPFYRTFCLASLLLVLPLPILSCAWTDESDVRYLFNWLVLPAFLLAIELAPLLTVAPGARQRTARQRTARRWSTAGALVLLAAGLGWSLAGRSRPPLRFPYPADVRALDTFLAGRGLRRGLAEYWNAKYLTNLSHTGIELRQIQPGGDPKFWDNNAFGYYEAGANGTFTWPAYGFILADTLDEQRLTATYGPPKEKTEVGPFHVWIYAPEGQRRIRAVLEPLVRAKLGPRRLPTLRLAAPEVERQRLDF